MSTTHLRASSCSIQQATLLATEGDVLGVGRGLFVNIPRTVALRGGLDPHSRLLFSALPLHGYKHSPSRAVDWKGFPRGLAKCNWFTYSKGIFSVGIQCQITCKVMESDDYVDLFASIFIESNK